MAKRVSKRAGVKVTDETAVENKVVVQPAEGGEGDGKTQKQAKRIMQPAGCRTYMRKRLASEFPKIVDGFVEEAKKGSCNHVKQAMEMLKPVRKGTPRRKGPAERLLAELLED